MDIAMHCVSCDDPLPAAAQFCPSCGQRVAAAGGGGGEERKVVTVVFCDLVGSTALSGTLDPEPLRGLTLRYFELMRRQVEAHGGIVEKFIGDAVMAVFGVPTVHEYDARRALAAALGMLDDIGQLNAELEASFGIRLNIRIGVNTGQVVASGEATARQALISGETVNVAARLEQNAPAGRILLGPATLAAVGSGVRVEKVGPLRLKGKADPVDAYRLVGLSADIPEPLRVFDTPFVGRAGELAALDSVLARATRLGAQLLCVLGDAGLGKSRLVGQWLGTPAARSASQGVGHCRPYGDRGSLAPLADAVHALLDAALPVKTPDAAATADGLLAILRSGLLHDGTPNPSVEETRGALARLLRLCAAERPVVLVIDDCHWAEKSLLEVLDDMVPALGDAPVGVICIARPEIAERWTKPAAAHPSMRLLVLDRLSDAESTQLAAALTEVTAHWESAPDSLLVRAEGNPLHLEQLIAAASETGADELPPTMQALLGARIDALDRTARIVLDLAAVLGRDFSLAELDGLVRGEREGTAGGPLRRDADAAGDPLRDALARLTARRLIEPAYPNGCEPGTYHFHTGLIQEAAYQCMSKRARAKRHILAADLPTVRERGPSAVGRHLERAYDYRIELGFSGADTAQLARRAAAELAEGGSRALARSDLVRAEDSLARSVRLADRGESDSLAARRLLGEVRLALGRVAEGRLLLRGVLTAQADPVQAAHARLALAALDPATGRGLAARTAEAVLPVFEAAADDLGQARACLRIAQQYQFQGLHDQADPLLSRALVHALRQEAEPECAAILGAMGISLWRGSVPVPAAIKRARSLLAEHCAGRRTVMITLNCPLAVLLAMDDRIDQARSCLETAARLAEELGYAEARAFLPVFAAATESAAGNRDRALRALSVAVAAADELEARLLRGSIARDAARLLLDTGLPRAAAEWLALDGATEITGRADAADLAGIKARIAAGARRPGEAEALSRAAVSEAGLTDSSVLQAYAALDRAQVLLALGRAGPARAWASRARRRFADKGHLPGVRQADRFAQASGLESGGG